MTSPLRRIRHFNPNPQISVFRISSSMDAPKKKMKIMIYKKKRMAKIPLKNCPLFHQILLMRKAREPYMRAFINNTLADAARKIDKEFRNK